MPGRRDIGTAAALGAKRRGSDRMEERAVLATSCVLIGFVLIGLASEAMGVFDR